MIVVKKLGLQSTMPWGCCMEIFLLTVKKRRWMEIKNDHGIIYINFFQCFVKCIFRKKGFINQNGEVQKEFIIKSLSDYDNAKRIRLIATIDKCSKLDGSNACENAYKVCQKCFFCFKGCNFFYYSFSNASWVKLCPWKTNETRK